MYQDFSVNSNFRIVYRGLHITERHVLILKRRVEINNASTRSKRPRSDQKLFVLKDDSSLVTLVFFKATVKST